MTDIMDQKRQNLFNHIRDAIAALEDGSLNDMERTHIIFDVLEQIIARTIAGTVIDEYTLEKTCKHSFDNIKKLAQHFYQQTKV